VRTSIEEGYGRKREKDAGSWWGLRRSWRGEGRMRRGKGQGVRREWMEQSERWRSLVVGHVEFEDVVLAKRRYHGTREEVLLGTVGCLAQAGSLCHDRCCVASGDVVLAKHQYHGTGLCRCWDD